MPQNIALHKRMCVCVCMCSCALKTIDSRTDQSKVRHIQLSAPLCAIDILISALKLWHTHTRVLCRQLCTHVPMQLVISANKINSKAQLAPKLVKYLNLLYCCCCCKLWTNAKQIDVLIFNWTLLLEHPLEHALNKPWQRIKAVACKTHNT